MKTELLETTYPPSNVAGETTFTNSGVVGLVIIYFVIIINCVCVWCAFVFVFVAK
jgi:hypothetical protein